MSNTIDTSISAPGLLLVAILFVIWAFLFYLARIWSKVTKSDKWGWDGTLISLAMAAAIVHVCCISYAIHCGYGEAWSDHTEASDRLAIEKSSHNALYAAQLFFVISTGLTRASTAVFTVRILSPQPTQSRLAISMIAVCGIWTLAPFLLVALRAPYQQPWTTIDGSVQMFTRWMVIDVVGIIIDSGTLLLSIVTVWALQMSVMKRLTVCALFAVRLLIVPVVACRLWHLRPANYESTDAYNGLASMFTEAEIHLCLILASTTSLKPFLAPFHPGYYATASAAIAVTGYTNKPGGGSQGGAYYELSRVSERSNKAKKQPEVRLSRTKSQDDASDQIDLIHPHNRPPRVAALRPGGLEHRSSAVAGSHADQGVNCNPLHIEATRTWTVSYEK